jgi:hypothetical protein
MFLWLQVAGCRLQVAGCRLRGAGVAAHCGCSRGIGDGVLGLSWKRSALSRVSSPWVIRVRFGFQKGGQ